MLYALGKANILNCLWEFRNGVGERKVFTMEKENNFCNLIYVMR